METSQSSRRIHPLIAAAAVSVMLASLVGAAAITGILPTSHSGNTPVITSTTPSASAAIAAESAGTDMNGKATEDTAVAPLKSPAAPATPSRHTPSHTAHARPAQPRTSHDEGSVALARAPGICSSCGQVESIQPVQHAEKPSGLGVVAGAVLGGVLGNHVGGGNGRALATVAGAVGGGYAGNEVEKRTRSTTSYNVRVRMEDGNIRTFPYAAAPGWNVGDRVQVVNGSLTARG